MTQPTTAYDPEQVIADLANQVGVLTAQLSIRASAISRLESRVAELEADVTALGGNEDEVDDPEA